DGFAAEHRGPHRPGAGRDQPAGAIEGKRVPLLADANVLDLPLQLEQVERRTHGATRLAGGNADVHRWGELGDVRFGGDLVSMKRRGDLLAIEHPGQLAWGRLRGDEAQLAQTRRIERDVGETPR